MTDIESDLIKILNKKDILVNEPMKKHTSFKIGGNADYFVIIRSTEILRNLLLYCKKKHLPFFIVGNGTNLLVLDGGIRGIVGKLEFNKIEISDTTVRVSADNSVSKLSKVCGDKGLTGMEFLSGIPGTVGGAIKMNAGAFDSEIKDILVKSICLDEKGSIIELSNKDHEFSYRKSIIESKRYIILEAEFELKKSDKMEIIAKMNEYLETRKQKQPVEFPSAGSTFKRSPNAVTAKLIDECGLKCSSIGDAAISEKHAGFIINKGNATAKDVLDLIDYTKKAVYKKFGEKIELEIEIVGEK